MQNLNHTLFLLLHASPQPDAGVLYIANLLAIDLIAIVPLTLCVGWLWGRDLTRRHMLEAGVAALFALLLAMLIGHLWPQPRPFVLGWGQQWLAHAADASFPSDHLTLMWSVSFSLLLHSRTRAAGAVLALLGIPMAWARIYLGVHSPLDMLGSIVVSATGAYASLWAAPQLNPPLFAATHALHQRMLGPWIRKGWVRA